MFREALTIEFVDNFHARLARIRYCYCDLIHSAEVIITLDLIRFDRGSLLSLLRISNEWINLII